jgi:hypothetical protein
MELSEQEFADVMENIDRALLGESFRISARPIQATLRILQKYRCSGPIATPYSALLDYPVTALNLANHISVWYEHRYGDRLNVDWSPGRFPIVIEAEIYVCKLPFAIGGERFMLASKNRFADPRILNAVDFIGGLPEMIRGRLEDDVAALANAMFATSMEVTKELHSTRATLLRAAKTDIDLSCDCLSTRIVDASQSAWHSLQFAEKILKEFISRTRAYSRHHRIDDLRDEAIDCGYEPDRKIEWRLFGFGAGVRYDPNIVAPLQAVAANHEAWRIGCNVLKQLH